jgi:hypothetical protein
MEERERYLARSPDCGSVGGDGGKMTALNEMNRLVNRHKARLLSNLEAACCPQIFRNAVVSELDWLRADLNKIESIGGNNEGENNGFNR